MLPHRLSHPPLPVSAWAKKSLHSSFNTNNFPNPRGLRCPRLLLVVSAYSFSFLLVFLLVIPPWQTKPPTHGRMTSPGRLTV
jgi:hypothetical protein